MRIGLLGLAAAAALAGSLPGQSRAETAASTASGIALDSPWKAAIYRHAVEQLAHPAWGWTHSERDYHLARRIAREEGLAIDDDVLFAAAFTHDIGAIAPFAQDGVDHAVRSAELARGLLEGVDFPMEKFPAVERAILGHMYDKQPGDDATAIVLHDADALDFLGVIGLVRRIGVTGAAPSVANGLARVESVLEDAPKGLKTATARAWAAERAETLRKALETLKEEAVGVPF